jgi:hypothetical protein
LSIAHRTLFPKDELEVEPAKKMTPRKKQLTTKVKKMTPKKKGGKGKGK